MILILLTDPLLSSKIWKWRYLCLHWMGLLGRDYAGLLINELLRITKYCRLPRVPWPFSVYPTTSTQKEKSNMGFRDKANPVFCLLVSMKSLACPQQPLFMSELVPSFFHQLTHLKMCFLKEFKSTALWKTTKQVVLRCS